MVYSCSRPNCGKKQSQMRCAATSCSRRSKKRERTQGSDLADASIVFMHE